jgi:RNA polymerase sigma-70 factor (ECF subfamily)
MSAGELTLTIREAEVPGRGRPQERSRRFELLLAEHQQRVLRTAYRLLGRLEDAQDAAQEVFLRLLKHIDNIEGDPQFWLYRVTVNICNDHYRRRPFVVEVPDLQFVDPAPNAEGVLHVAERKRLLMAGIARLPERERESIVLRDIEGLTTREVAQVLGVEEVTVRAHICAGRAKLVRYVRSRI